MYEAAKRDQWQHVSVGFVVVLVLGLAEWVGLLQLPRRAGESLLQPVNQVSNQVVQVLMSPLSWSVQMYQQARRIQDLEQRYAHTLAQVSELSALKQENEALKQLIENADRRLTPSLVSAPLVALAEPAVAAGQVEGVKLDQVVLVSGVVVGRISSVSEHVSQVRLITARESQAILAKTESGVEGIVTGDGKRVVLTELPLDISVQPGERVVTVGQPGVPPDLFIGTIQTIKTQANAPVQTAQIDQVISFYQARIVEIR